MGALDYSRFDRLDASSSSSSDDEDIMGGSEEGRAHSSEGMLRAFTVIHERRLEVDQLLAAALPSNVTSVTPDRHGKLRWLAAAYDDVCNRLLALDGVCSEAKMRSLGHRAEAVKARLGAARALLAAADDREAALAAKARATSAIEAMALSEELRKKGVKVQGIPDRRDDQLLHIDAGEVYFCRAKACARLCEYSRAREDALEAYSLAKHRGKEALKEECQQFAIRMEIAMHAGGPGPDGQGEPLEPGELDEIEVSSYGVASEGTLKEFNSDAENCNASTEECSAEVDMNTMD